MPRLKIRRTHARTHAARTHTTPQQSERRRLPCVSQKQRASEAAISLGQTVISKHKNLRYYSSRVTQVSSQAFYEVMFDDGSFSNDTYPEDIVVRPPGDARTGRTAVLSP